MKIKSHRIDHGGRAGLQIQSDPRNFLGAGLVSSESEMAPYELIRDHAGLKVKVSLKTSRKRHGRDTLECKV